MKLCTLLKTLVDSTVIWIATSRTDDGVFLGFAEDAEANIPGEFLFGDVTEVYAEYYRAYDRAGISILVKPYKSA